MAADEGPPIRLAVALEGAGWHPAAWREPAARPTELFAARYWTDLVQEAERARLDFVTFEDALGLQSSRFRSPDERIDQVRGRLDAVLIAARVAPVTSGIGLVPTVVVTHTEPFHVSKAIATLDYASQGRAGVRVQVTARQNEAAHFGRRVIRAGDDDPDDLAAGTTAPDLLGEAADYVEVLRRLWDSWEDDAEIRDVPTGRFVARERLHYIDFAGPHFSVKGPSITPRPPQGQPIVTALAHGSPAYAVVGRSADVGFVTPIDADAVRIAIEEIRGWQSAAGRGDETVHVFADLEVYLAATEAAAVDRKARLDDRSGREHRSDALSFTGTPSGLADLLVEWSAAGLAGFRLRPATIPDDLEAITRALVPELQRRGVFRRTYEMGTLRGRLGLPRPDNRYTTGIATSA
jgi:alkanesulfonate monooxygenase SsuD/methylene tetrahydromethanopterin reductase-like flavin-dependent oxidoreductase (luciferase family)